MKVVSAMQRWDQPREPPSLQGLVGDGWLLPLLCFVSRTYSEGMDTSWVKGIDYTNLLAALDILDDLVCELNIAALGQPVSIPLWNQLIKFQELQPMDSPGVRDAYMERRYKMAGFLKAKGVIEGFSLQTADHRWQNRLVVVAQPKTVEKLLMRVPQKNLQEERKRFEFANDKTQRTENLQPKR